MALGGVYWKKFPDSDCCCRCRETTSKSTVAVAGPGVKSIFRPATAQDRGEKQQSSGLYSSSRLVDHLSGGQTWFLEQTCVVRPSWGPISTIRTFARQSHHFGLWVRFPLHFPVQLPVQCSAGSRSFWQVMSVSLICVIEYFTNPQYLLPLISLRWQFLFWIFIKMWCQATHISKTALTFHKKIVLNQTLPWCWIRSTDPV